MSKTARAKKRKQKRRAKRKPSVAMNSLLSTKKPGRPRRMAASLMDALTGASLTEWAHRVQEAIRKTSKKTHDPWHDTNDPRKVIERLAKAVWQTMPKSGPPYDGNMRMAMVLGMVLTHWYLRTQRAKAFDPRRPIALRKTALANWRASCQTLLSCMIDDTDDARIFPSQRWESPNDPHTIDGYFI